jgi:hypothetical protein
MNKRNKRNDDDEYGWELLMVVFAIWAAVLIICNSVNLANL